MKYYNEKLAKGLINTPKLWQWQRMRSREDIKMHIMDELCLAEDVAQEIGADIADIMFIEERV